MTDHTAKPSKNPIVILDNHFYNDNTLIYNKWVMNGKDFFDSQDEDEMDLFWNRINH